MKATFRRTLLGAGLATVTLVVVGATAVTAPDGHSRDKLNVSYHEKPQSRVLAFADDDWPGRGAPIEETQLIEPPHWGEGAFGGPPRRVMPPFGLAPPPGPMARGPFGPPLGPVFPPSPRAACEGQIDQLMAHVGYLRSRMRLQANQKAAWLKVEQAAEPSLEKLRDLCGQLPSQLTQPPAPLEALDFAEKQMTSRLDLLRAVRGPMQELHDILSPEQRTLLVPRPPSLGHGPLPDDDNL